MDQCNKIVHSLEKGVKPYKCNRTYYKDGWCKIHHPELIAKRAEEKAVSLAGFLARNEANNKLTIENSIVLLVKNGYRVEKIMTQEKASS